MSKTLLLIIVIIAVAIGFWFWNSNREVQVPGPGVLEGEEGVIEVSEDDTTGQIQQDLDQTNIQDLESEFKEIDSDLNNL